MECITQWTAYLEGLLPQERCQLLDAPDQNGLNALHYLAESKNSQLVEKLVELGAGACRHAELLVWAYIAVSQALFLIKLGEGA